MAAESRRERFPMPVGDHRHRIFVSSSKRILFGNFSVALGEFFSSEGR